MTLTNCLFPLQLPVQKKWIHRITPLLPKGTHRVLFTIYKDDIVLHHSVHYFHLFFYVLMTDFQITDPFVCKLGI